MSISDIELYHHPVTRSARVKWLLHELLGDAFTVHRINLYNGDALSEDYLQVNPNHTVPLIRFRTDDGARVTVFESGAILTLLADAFPERALAPPPEPLSAVRADYLQMLYFGAATIDMILWQIRIHKHVLPQTQRDDRTIDRYRKKFAAEIGPQLAARLECRDFICGPTFSAADCMIGYDVIWARSYGLCVGEVFDRYVARLTASEAFTKAFADRSEFRPQVMRDAPLLKMFLG